MLLLTTLYRLLISILLKFFFQILTGKASTRSGRKTSNTIKNKVQRATCNPTNNSGYIGKDFRIQHQVSL